MSKFYCNKFGFIVDPDKGFPRDKCIEVTPDDREGMIVRLLALYDLTRMEPAFPDSLCNFAIEKAKELSEGGTDGGIFMVATKKEEEVIKPSTNQQLELF